MLEKETRVAIHSTPVAMDAELLCGVLDAEGIVATVGERYSAGVTNFMTRTMHGTLFEVLVAEDDADMARALLEAYEAGRGTALSESELEAAAEASFDPRV
jgi:hypothetical protein